MPYEAFIRIGEDDPREIAVLSFHWAVSQLGPPGAGGAAGGNAVQVQDFSFVKRVDAVSPGLFVKCCRGERFPAAIFVVRQSIGARGERLQYAFRDVTITSVRPGGSPLATEDFPAEEISLSFARCEIDYWSERADGGTAARPEHGEWSLVPER